MKDERQLVFISNFLDLGITRITCTSNSEFSPHVSKS